MARGKRLRQKLRKDAKADAAFQRQTERLARGDALALRSARAEYLRNQRRVNGQ